MQELSEKEFIDLLKSGQLTPYNLYNLDIDYTQLYSVDNYINNPNDNPDKDQLLNILFLDIEVFTNNAGLFPEPTDANYPINAITIYSTFENIFRSYILLGNENIIKFPTNDIQKLENDYKKILLENKYITENNNIKIEFFGNEMDLIRSVWHQIHLIDPVILSGWNSDQFDIPYIYYRLNRLLNKNDVEVNKILSKFGSVKVNHYHNNTIIKISDYSVADLLHLYKPRDDGGLNLGSKQPSYSLDWVSDDELGLKKLEYKDEGTTLDNFYLENPVSFLLYNIMDVCLVVNLNKKLKHIEGYNTYRRLMRTSFDSSLRGSSILFDTFVLYELKRHGKYIRFGINDETNIEITANDISNIPTPTGKKSIKWNITKLESNTIKNVIGTFPGAYVKDSPGKVYTADDGLIISLDASLPPFEKIYIRRNNIIQHIEIGEYIYQEGDETLTWDQNNVTCWKKVLGKTEHDWDDDLVYIATETGKYTTVTNNHSIFGLKQKCYDYDTPQLIDAGNLNNGDYVVGFKQFEPDGIKVSTYPELIGFWLSDGWANSKNGSYYISKQDVELLEIFSKGINNIRMKRAKSVKYKEEWIGTIIEPVRTELKDFYTLSTRKNFFNIINYTKDQRKRIWEGMMFADGTLHGLNNIDVMTPTERLCKYRLEELLECFSIAHTIGWCPKLRQNAIDNCPKRKVDGSRRYGPEQVCPEVFRSHIGYGSILSKNNMAANCRHTLNKIGPLLPYVYNSYSNYIGLEKITFIQKKHYTGKVYDISVEETERFFTGTGIGAHNTSLYPSMIAQSNISFDSFFGRIIDPNIYKTIDVLKNNLGNINIYKQICTNILELAINYVEKKGFANKNDAYQQYYYVTCYMFYKALIDCKNFDNMLEPKTYSDYILLKNYFLNLCEMMEMIHPNSEEYNSFCYDRFVNHGEKFTNGFLYIIENFNETNLKINKINIIDFNKYLEQNNLIVTLSGALFYQHDKKMGLFSDWLQIMAKRRKEHKTLRDQFGAEKGLDCPEYKFYNMTQNATKTAMNTSYGLYGLTSFRYSNHHLAKAITTEGRFMLKICQQISEMVIEQEKQK